VTLALDLFNLKLCDAETQRRQYQNFHVRWSPHAMKRCIIRDITAIFWLHQSLGRRRFMDSVVRLEEFLGLVLQYFWRDYIHMPIPMWLAAVLREPVVFQFVQHA
jgi:hypothetical protein